MLEFLKYCLGCFLMLFAIASGKNPEGATLISILVGFATGITLFVLLLAVLCAVSLIMRCIRGKP